MHLVIQSLSLASLQTYHWNKGTNISNKRNLINPNWQGADQLAIYKAWPRIWTRDYWETNPASGRVETLNPGLPDYNTSALNYSVALSCNSNTSNSDPTSAILNERGALFENGMERDLPDPSWSICRQKIFKPQPGKLVEWIALQIFP